MCVIKKRCMAPYSIATSRMYISAVCRRTTCYASPLHTCLRFPPLEPIIAYDTDDTDDDDNNDDNEEDEMMLMLILLLMQVLMMMTVLTQVALITLTVRFLFVALDGMGGPAK